MLPAMLCVNRQAVIHSAIFIQGDAECVSASTHYAKAARGTPNYQILTERNSYQIRLKVGCHLYERLTSLRWGVSESFSHIVRVVPVCTT